MLQDQDLVMQMLHAAMTLESSAFRSIFGCHHHQSIPLPGSNRNVSQKIRATSTIRRFFHKDLLHIALKALAWELWQALQATAIISWRCEQPPPCLQNVGVNYCLHTQQLMSHFISIVRPWVPLYKGEEPTDQNIMSYPTSITAP